MRFIEFFGLPGSGKSTISHRIAEDLRKKGVAVYEPTYSMDHGKIRSARSVKKFLCYLSSSVCKGKLIKKIKKIVSENGYSGADAFKHVVNIAYKIRAINGLRSKDGFVFFDEGLVQSAVSLAINEKKSVNENVKELFAIAGKDYSPEIVFIRTSERVALSRAAERRGNFSRVEKIKDENARKAFMKKYTGICSAVSVVYYEFDGEKTVNDLAAEIIETVISSDCLQR